MSKKRKQTMSFRDAMELVDDDLPDGAFWAMAHELAGLEYGDGFAELAEEEFGTPAPKPRPKKHIPCTVNGCGRKFVHSKARDQHVCEFHNKVKP